MTKSYRLRTKPGIDQNIRININQDFDFLEILSLKLRQEDVYTRFCSDYGVVVGRVVANGGFGIPNANVSIFVPLSSIDENDPVISTLYPYKFLEQKNEDGYRYNLLPYVQEYGGHEPTGTFPSREDVLTRKEVLEIYEKYYKYTVKTNESGDFMIVGVPLGNQKIVVDLDLSNMGCFSLRPTDLIRMGRGVAEQFNGDRFKSSSDLGSLPQLFNTAKDIDVTPFWGEEDICNIGITRVDFDLRDYNIDIKPQATFMGSVISTSDEDFMRTNCKTKNDTGNLCDMVKGPGRILAIRQTKDLDVDGRPVLEQYNLEDGGKVIDENGTWLVEVPMNLDYVTTNEFGEQVFSADPNVGVPTKGKYRFRIQYQNESGLNSPIQRADYLVPNIKEWGWDTGEVDTSAPPLDTVIQLQNYAFSLDWNDYGDTGTTLGLAMIQEAIDCKDRFYEFNYNKVYTVSSFIDRWKWGFGRAKHLGIKEITDRSCTNSTNRFPVNDGVRNFDFIYFLFNIIITILTPVIYTLIIIAHVLAALYPILRIIINLIIWIINVLVYGICRVVALLSAKLKKEDCKKTTIKPLPKDNPFKRLSLPMMSYPDCEACPCESSDLIPDESDFGQQAAITISSVNVSLLSDINSVASFDRDFYEGNGITGGNPTSYNSGANQLFSGYQIQGIQGRDKLVKMPIVEVPQQGAGSFLYLGSDVTLAQSLNLMNQRSRYFEPTIGPNRIQTTVKNTHPVTNIVQASDPFEDNLLIILCDPGTLSNLPAGQLLTFNDLENINDPNITGLTVPNQFNSNTITGSTPYNATQLVTKTITSIDPDWSLTSKNIKLKITENGKEYKFKAGTEYFQVLTGDTYQNYLNITSQSVTNTLGGEPRWDSILNEYLFKKIQTVRYGLIGPGPSTRINVYSTEFLDGKEDFEIIFLTKGVDPYTQKQRIEYDLSKIFGYNYGSGPIITGDYYLNIPIQDNSGSGPWHNDTLTPESHDVSNNTNTKLYHEPFGFDVDTNLFTAFTNNSPHYYNSTDKSRVGHLAYNGDTYTLGGLTNQGITTNNNRLWFQVYYVPPVGSGYDLYKQQGLIEGASVQASGFVPDPNSNPAFNTITGLGSTVRAFSPAYHLETLNNPNITITANNRLVFRSDRLPTSDITEVYGNTSFSLHLNDNFGFYLVDENGIGISTPGLSMVATDNTGNYQNLVDDGNQFAGVIDSLSCENMKPLKCYQGSGSQFSVIDDCDDNKMGKDDLNKRVNGGCYYFVDNPLIASIPKDIKYYEEWKARFRFQFAACRGVVSHVFQNNWVNGTLYMFSFKNVKRFTILGDLKRYKYCGDPLSYRPNQGPIVFTFGTTNSFFYRATPYNYQTNQFVGQLPKKIDLVSEVWESASNYGGMNEKNIFFPTTVMDLGPRDEFTKEICFNPQFEGYLVDTLRSTSFNDSGDILQLFILSRLINSNFWGQVLGLGDASLNRIFSRSEDRIDGDFAQAMSINSEYGVDGFSSDDYNDNSIYVENSGADPLFGIFFSSDTATRKLMSPGETSYTAFGYPKTQVVPMYKWNSETQTTIFGSDENNWETDGPFYSQPYQSMGFSQSDYFKPSNGEDLGYIYNRTSSLNITTSWPSGQNSSYVVGAPYHFYFGLQKGASAMNRYITKYIFNQ